MLDGKTAKTVLQCYQRADEGRHRNLGDLAAEIAKQREANGWNPAMQPRKFNAHDKM